MFVLAACSDSASYEGVSVPISGHMRAHTLEETRALKDEKEPAAALRLILRVCTHVGDGMQYAVCSMKRQM